MFINFNVQGNFSKFFHDWFAELREQLENEISELAAQRAEEITEWMQENAPWQDETGAARASLLAEVVDAYEGIVEIELSYSDPDVFYSVYLETMQAGRFEILGPAMDHWMPILIKDIRGILNQ